MNTQTPTCYEAKAHATRRRRRNAGQYATPTELATYKKAMARGGDKNLTPADIALLATCKWLPASQRRHFAALAQA